MILTPYQIAQYAYKAGFRGRDLLIAVGVAIRESGGNTQAYNPESAAGTAPGSGSRGLWQIYGTAHPQYNNALVFDPQANANAAYQVYKQSGGKFTPWSTWNNGSVLPLLPQLQNLLGGKTRSSTRNTSTPSRVATTPANRVQAGTSVSSTPLGTITATSGKNEQPNPVSQFLDAFGLSQKQDGTNWLAVGGGVVLIIIGLVALFVISGGVEKTGKLIATGAKVATVI